MAALKGSQTEQNLRTALMGESLARNKYTYFAEVARHEGNEQIAALFTRMAENECIHAKLFYKRLFGALGTSEQNITDAAAAENGEWSDLYPAFAQTARDEGFADIAMLFDKISEIERAHEQTFLERLAELQQQPRQQREQVQGARCKFCGAIFEKPQRVCPVCGAMDSFEPCMISK